MKKILLPIIVLLSKPAIADDWIVVKTTREYQVKITQPNEKYDGYDIIWQKLLMYNRSYFVAKVIWHCPSKTFKTIVSMVGYHDEPIQVDYGIIDSFHTIGNDEINQAIYKIVCS